MVNRIYNSQQQLAVDFKTLLRELSLSNVFTTVELSEVRTAFYAIEEVVNTDVKLLVTVLTPNKFRMSDGERTDVVSKIKQSIDRQVLKLNVLRDDYYKQMILRSQKKRDIGAVRKLGTIH